MRECRNTAAIVLAAGKGTRMESDIQKQYLELGGKPLIYYALKAFEDSPVKQIILVTGRGETGYCRKEIVERFGFQKVSQITEGGRERYHSVFEGLKAVTDCDIVLIHDGARPCVTGEIISAAVEGAGRYGACVVGMPVKDTVKMSDDDEFAVMTPDRSRLWQIRRLLEAAFIGSVSDRCDGRRYGRGEYDGPEGEADPRRLFQYQGDHAGGHGSGGGIAEKKSYDLADNRRGIRTEKRV